jgi:hypothetical protein
MLASAFPTPDGYRWEVLTPQGQCLAKGSAQSLDEAARASRRAYALAVRTRSDVDLATVAPGPVRFGGYSPGGRVDAVDAAIRASRR